MPDPGRDLRAGPGSGGASGARPGGDRITISLTGLTLRTHLGVTEAEREVGQRLEVDVEIAPADCGATLSDEVSGTIDYGEVANLVTEIATGEGFATLERLAAVLADRLDERFRFRGLRLRLTKPDPPIANPTGSATVELVRGDG